jgi:hypothetical protein
MKTCNTLGELRTLAPASFCSGLAELLRSIEGDLPPADLDRLDLSACLGGPVHIVEAVADLAAVRTLELDTSGRLSILATASAWFDLAEWVDDGAWALFVVIESPDGGPQFLIPRAVADMVPNVAASIAMTQARTG